jgi:flagellar hook-length control protein FliK
MNQTRDAGEPVAGEMLVALMAQLAAPAAEPDVALPLVAWSSAGATAQQTAGRATSTPTGIEVLTAATDQSALSATPGGGVPDPAPVTAAINAAESGSGAASAAVSELEQRQTMPLAPTPAEIESVAGPPEPVVESPIVEELAPADAETFEVDAAADEAILKRPVAEPVPTEVRSTAAREPATPANVDVADAAVPPVSQPVTSSSRSTPVSATEPAVAPPNNEVFTADLAGTVRRASLLGDQEVRLLLNPPELGHLDVRVVESPQGLRVVLEATSAEARELIEQQLPALRTALEARDLKVERLQVEQALDASALDEQSERGLRQDGQGEGGSDQSGQDTAPWSPVASMQLDGGGEPALAGAASGSESNTRTAAGDGRLDVLA